MDSTFLLSFILLGYIQSGNAVYQLFTSCGKNINVGESCTLICNTGSTDTAIFWYNGTRSTAIDSSDCNNTGGLPTDYTSSCPSPGVYELTISGAQYGRDSHAWSCSNYFGGTPSNTTDSDTFVSVPLPLPTVVTETKPTIECFVVTSPQATLKLSDITTEIKTETNYNRTWDGLKTTLSAQINGSGSYFCCADNGNEKRCSNFTISDEVTTPPPTTTPPPPETTESMTTSDTTTSVESSTSTSAPNTTDQAGNCTSGTVFSCPGHRIELTVFLSIGIPVVIELVIILIFCIKFH